ncbi:MAG: cytochrome c biogenesis protein CcdA [Candidatus Omnitrophota bacterium]
MHLSGTPFDYLVAFLGGILLSLTPCVYPVLPVVAGYIGIKAAGSKWKGFVFSFIYVSGMALVYSLLGIFVSLTGGIFGALSSRPEMHLAVGLVIIAFGLSMLDVFKMPLPGMRRPFPGKGKGYFSVFFLGFASGLVLSPCVTPVLGAILSYLVTRKNIFYGASLLLSFAYGMGLLLLITGTFSAALAGLPKSGRWMNYIKKGCAVILIATGIYFIVSAF